METAINYVDDGDLFVSSDERRWITQIRKLALEHPETVSIIRQPETNDGCIYARINDKRYLNIRAPKKMNLTDEQREEIRQRFQRNTSTQSKK